MDYDFRPEKSWHMIMDGDRAVITEMGDTVHGYFTAELIVDYLKSENPERDYRIIEVDLHDM